MSQISTSERAIQSKVIETMGLEAVPFSLRTTPWYRYMFIQIAISANAGNFLIPALAVLEGGLSFTSAIAATSVGAIIAFIFVSYLSLPGGRYGLPSQYAIRTMLGGKGARFLASPIRSLTSLYWFSVQTIGGTYVIQQLIVRLTGTEYPFLMLSIPISLIMILLAIIGFEAVKRATTYFLPLLLAGEGTMLYIYFTTSESNHSLFTLTPEGGHGSFSAMAFYASLAFVQYISGVSASADMTRYAKSPRQGAIGLMLGNSFGFMLTAILGSGSAYLFGELNPYVSASEHTSIPIFIAIITATAILSMLSINMSNAYTGGYSLLNTFPSLTRLQSALLFGIFGISFSSVPALVNEAEQFISGLGGLIIPISAVIVIDFLYVKRSSISNSDLLSINENNRISILPLISIGLGTICYFALPVAISPGFITFVLVSILYGLLAKAKCKSSSSFV
ncbi:purine-cytosine permease family protein [Pontibacillus salicampi]|uniref:Purine-cytosine permease family protein n=1 Tax=Pontibacillus salicampi TaxID=1449801 RepID=A0ABV6LJ49_9BACI